MKKRILAITIATIMIFTSLVTSSYAIRMVYSVSMPNVTVKVGETKTVPIEILPVDTTEYCNIQWGFSNINGKIDYDADCGTFWGKTNTIKITGKSVGTVSANITVIIYDKPWSREGGYKEGLTFNRSYTITVVDSSTEEKQVVPEKESEKDRPAEPKNKPIEENTTPTVKEIHVDSYGLRGALTSPSKNNIKTEQTVSLTASYGPSNTTDKVTYSWGKTGSSVSLTPNGSKATVRGVTTGESTITLKYIICDIKGNVYKTKTTNIIFDVTKEETSQPQKEKEKVEPDGYVDCSSAYTLTNNFRTSKSVWYWKSGNKSKKYFNTTSKNKLSKLKKNSSLEKTAKTRAKELATKFSHTRPNGKDCFTAYPSSMTYRGENIACGYTTCKSVIEAWKETNEKYSGQGHRRNMLNKNFKKIGIACYRKDGVLYWCQAFGA